MADRAGQIGRDILPVLCHDDGIMKRTSAFLDDILQLPPEGTTTIGRFAAMLGDRSFPLALLVFSLPNALLLAGIPGFSTLTGIPMLFIAAQIVAGRGSLWLPRAVAGKPVTHRVLHRIVTKARPIVLWLERFLRPRLTGLCSGRGERFIGLLIALLVLVLIMPFPGSNFLPGVAISLLVLALLEEDGVFALFAIAFCGLTFYLMYLFVTFMGAAASGWLEWL